MMYFIDITNIEQAKIRYRKLVKQLHPDKGGSANEFQEMQEEYKILLIHLQHKTELVNRHNPRAENELINELGKLAKVLIKNQVPQNYLRQQIKTTDSNLKRGLFSEVVKLLNNL